MFATPATYVIPGACPADPLTLLQPQSRPQHQGDQQQQQVRRQRSSLNPTQKRKAQPTRRVLCRTESTTAGKHLTPTAAPTAPTTPSIGPTATPTTSSPPNTTSLALRDSSPDKTPAPFADSPTPFADSPAPSRDTLFSYGVRLGYAGHEVSTCLDALTSQLPVNGQSRPLTADALLAELLRREQQGVPYHGTSSTNTTTSSSATTSTTTASPSTTVTSPTPATSSNGPRLRPIVIDGNNVALCHGNRETFSAKGIRICVDYFLNRGHTDITVFLPATRREASRTDFKVKDQHLLDQLEREHHLVYTPAKRIQGRRVLCYDDRYVLKLARDTMAIAVSNDHYRDLLDEFREVIDNRVLMFSFVHDRFMPPDDPLGRNGPSLDKFLSLCSAVVLRPCPYKESCTYGAKCKYSHDKATPTKMCVADSISLQVECDSAQYSKSSPCSTAPLTASLTAPTSASSSPCASPTPIAATSSTNKEQVCGNTSMDLNHSRPRSHTADEIDSQVCKNSCYAQQRFSNCHDLRRTSSSPYSVNSSCCRDPQFDPKTSGRQQFQRPTNGTSCSSNSTAKSNNGADNNNQRNPSYAAPPSKNRVSQWFLEADRAHKILTTSKSNPPQPTTSSSCPPSSSSSLACPVNGATRVCGPPSRSNHQRVHFTSSDGRLANASCNRRQPVHITRSDVTAYTNANLHMFPRSPVAPPPPPPMQQPAVLLQNMQAPPPPPPTTPAMQAPPPQPAYLQACYPPNNMLRPHAMLYQTNSDPCDKQEHMGAARDKLFYELCCIFPADKVTEVMLAAPLETSPRILCSKLFQLNNK